MTTDGNTDQREPQPEYTRTLAWVIQLVIAGWLIVVFAAYLLQFRPYLDIVLQLIGRLVPLAMLGTSPFPG